MNIFQREQRSLFGEILDWMLTPLLLLWPVSLALTWLVAQELANKPFDRALEYNAQALAQLLVVSDGQLQFYMPRPASELLRADDSDMVYYQVLGVKGVLLSGEREFPMPPETGGGFEASIGQVQLRDDDLRGVDIRVASIWVRVPLDQEVLALVQVAETREKRSVLAAEIIKGVMLPQFVILPLSVLLVWLALARGIKPLHRLEERIRARKPDDLSPLNHKAVPMEVAPLVDAVNDLLRRLNDSIATQKRFLADAAHQLKTPLAGLRMQADLAQRPGTSTEDLKRSLQQIGRSSIRATHTVNQLLSLARAEGASTALQRTPCDMAELVIEVVQDCLPRAMDKHIDLGYDGAEPGTMALQVWGNATLLQELVRNLVDNAINYTPSSNAQPGLVTVRVLPDPFGRVVVLQVEDTGPGVPEAERDLVFQPFYRALGTEADGSGLGLPIVLEIARQHGAQVALEDVHPGQPMPGARFTVRFPAQVAE
ncbi:sensor histidine kinase N-terminal domain-containing protein [Comamonas sp. CMM01]|uniref:sensor histidine kinase n=1 Tax=Comamonas TaxID=283 RepID=UPI001785CC3A|nr:MULTISPECIES: sensor histidine kinase [Comamonas]MBD9532725.1 sensor histidine kinase N-terminal domain-containing protein [Comamonas sp. CMM01]MDH0048577.1 sensor histidine kinase N-terminal domain-containing protein [Comamonas terrigena]MDH0511557.1 sensor histidine kinase N-terminal domain-containing protein [Comamonas terrigena]MDH1090984.1 sensor histidine kinase N-terminal domain-containing protein [Comamonas terrigena]MDH1292608.1 sensor histidine kinase N-terminal domain-containing 